VADCAYFLNEGAPSSQPFWGAELQPARPEGYDYDTINADVLLNRMKVGEGGRLVLPDGMSYRILVLPQTDRLRPEILRKMRDLVAGGGIIAGPKPIKSPSLQNGADKADYEVQALANELWGDLDGIQRNKHYYGKGLVTWGLPIKDVLSLAGIPRDVEFGGPLDSSVVWTHRRAGDADIYFIANRADRPLEIQARFRVDGKEAEIWRPDTGTIEPAGYSIAGGRTTVPLQLDSRESLFVVFRRAATAPSRTLPSMTATTLTTLTGPWDLTFPPKLGAPEKMRLATLESWIKNSDDGVKYFSGTAMYAKTIQVPKNWLKPKASLVLDLGMVKDIAQVSINGRELAVLWKPPYKVDITTMVKAGLNRLDIKVSNEWTNRLIGDRAVDPSKRVLAPSSGGTGGFGNSATLSDAGLIGPVMLRSLEVRRKSLSGN
jgi:hypothetical protein